MSRPSRPSTIAASTPSRCLSVPTRSRMLDMCGCAANLAKLSGLQPRVKLAPDFGMRLAGVPSDGISKPSEGVRQALGVAEIARGGADERGELSTKEVGRGESGVARGAAHRDASFPERVNPHKDAEPRRE